MHRPTAQFLVVVSSLSTCACGRDNDHFLLSFILSHRNGQYVHSALPLDVVATASDASSIMFMDVRLYGGSWATMTFDVADLVWKGSVGAPGAGNHFIGVRATDSQGNVGPESVMLVIGDANDPSVSVAAPATDPDDVGGWLTVRVQASDQERLAGVKVYISDGGITYALDATLNPATGSPSGPTWRHSGCAR